MTDAILFHDDREGTQALIDACFDAGYTLLSDCIVGYVFVPKLVTRTHSIIGETAIRKHLELKAALGGVEGDDA